MAAAAGAACGALGLVLPGAAGAADVAARQAQTKNKLIRMKARTGVTRKIIGTPAASCASHGIEADGSSRTPSTFE